MQMTGRSGGSDTSDPSLAALQAHMQSVLRAAASRSAPAAPGTSGAVAHHPAADSGPSSAASSSSASPDSNNGGSTNQVISWIFSISSNLIESKFM